MAKLERYAGTDFVLMFKVLENYFNKKLPRSSTKLRLHLNLSNGDNFLVCPTRLFASKANIVYKYQYLILSSKRDLLHYSEYGITYLDLSFFPDVLIDNIKDNPLIKIENNKIYFLLED